MIQSKKKERNLSIDYLRALNMIYIICWIHILYWLPSKIPFKSLFLGEMIIVFFLMGASHSLSSKKKYLYYIVLRFQRIYLPYFVYGIVISFLTVLAFYSDFQEITTNKIVDLIAWIYPFRITFVKGGVKFFLPFIYWHLWFIPTSILVIPLIPILYKFQANIKQYVILMILLVIIIFIMNVYYLRFTFEYLNYAVFYLIFIILGFRFNELRAINLSIKILAVIVSLITLCLIKHFFLFGFDMQANKFPPNIMYLFFGLIWVAIISIALQGLEFISRINYLKTYLLWFSEYSYTAYLFHPLAYLLFFSIIKQVGKETLLDNVIFKHIIVPTFILLVVSLLNIVFGKIEKITLIKKRNET